jgi:hypothetical protein
MGRYKKKYYQNRKEIYKKNILGSFIYELRKATIGPRAILPVARAVKYIDIWNFILCIFTFVKNCRCFYLSVNTGQK